MNQETNNISNVLLELNKTIQVIGKDKLLELLKISRQNESNLNDEIKTKSQEVIKIVCDEFNIDVDDFYSRTRKNNRRYAIGITAMILKDYLNLDIADISFLLKKHRKVKYQSEDTKLDKQIIKKIKAKPNGKKGKSKNKRG